MTSLDFDQTRNKRVDVIYWMTSSRPGAAVVGGDLTVEFIAISSRVHDRFTQAGHTGEWKFVLAA